jgi:hypothetical protein
MIEEILAQYERGKQELSEMWSSIDGVMLAAKASDALKNAAGTPENATQVDAIERARELNEPVQLEAGLFEDTSEDTTVKDLTEEEAVEPPSNIQSVTDYMKSKGWKQSVINGMLGNIEVESAGSFDFNQHQIGGGRGHGLFQLDYMREPYKEYLGINGLSDSMESQIDFVDEIIKSDTYHDIGAGNREKLNTDAFNGTSGEYADLFARRLERPDPTKNPKYKERIDFANSLD